MRDVNERTSLLNDTEIARPDTESEDNASHSSLPTSGDSSASTPTLPAWAIVSVLLIGILVAHVDVSLIIASSSKVSGEFGALDEASWLYTSFSLAQCAIQPLYGKLSDIFGRKTNLVFAYLMFAAGCLLCGIARTYWQVLAGRAISGIGAAGMTALVSIIITELVPVRQIASWRSYVNVVATIGRSAGGPVGGWLADTVGWRWSFIGQVPVTLTGLLLILYAVPGKSEKADEHDDTVKASLTDKLKRVDVLGAIALASTISAFLLTLDFIAKESQLYLIMTLTSLTILSGSVFYVLESRLVKEPVVPIQLLTKRAAITSYMIVGTQSAAQSSLFYLVPIYFQITTRASVTNAGLHLVPGVVGNSLGGLLSGWVISRTGRYKTLTVVATVVASLAYLLILLRWRGSTGWLEMSYLLMGGFGMAIIQSTTFIHLAASLEPGEMAIAGATLYLASSAFSLVGVQLATTVVRAKLRTILEVSLEGFDNKTQIIQDSLSSLLSIWELAKKARIIVIAAYVDSLSFAYGLCVVFAVLGFMFGVSIREASQ